MEAVGLKCTRFSHAGPMLKPEIVMNAPQNVDRLGMYLGEVGGPQSARCKPFLGVIVRSKRKNSSPIVREGASMHSDDTIQVVRWEAVSMVSNLKR